MSDRFPIRIDGRPILVARGSTVAAAIASLNLPFRRSVSGEPRSAVCGMGICFECRVTINGEPHQRSCQLLCEPDSDIRTDG